MLKLKKSLGQNFLVDKNIINKIVNLENLENKNVIEIGPGSGNLTKVLNLKKPKSLIIFEKDIRFVKILREKLNLSDHEVISGDILNYNLDNIKIKDAVLFGNLPYNISTQILSKFIKVKSWPPFFKKIIFMFQNEVANRILAKVNTSNYGRLSILSNFRLEAIENFKISKKCFFPIPKVDSKIIVFKPKMNIDFKIRNIENLETISQVFFSNRRKMINKTFKKLFKNSSEIAKNLKINLSSRPGELDCETYYKITEIYERLKKY